MKISFRVPSPRSLPGVPSGGTPARLAKIGENIARCTGLIMLKAMGKKFAQNERKITQKIK
jgi:hypothetical protein